MKLLRPKQWVKNLLIFLGVLSSGDVSLLPTAVLVFTVFCLASSTAYVYNDIRDVASDRQHHRKKHRPIASGKVSIAQAWMILCFTSHRIVIVRCITTLCIPVHTCILARQRIIFKLLETGTYRRHLRDSLFLFPTRHGGYHGD